MSQRGQCVDVLRSCRRETNSWNVDRRIERDYVCRVDGGAFLVAMMAASEIMKGVGLFALRLRFLD